MNTAIQFIVWNIRLGANKVRHLNRMNSVATALGTHCQDQDYNILVLSECCSTVAQTLIQKLNDDNTKSFSLLAQDGYSGEIQFIYSLPNGWRLEALNSMFIFSEKEIVKKLIEKNNKRHKSAKNILEQIETQYLNTLYSVDHLDLQVLINDTIRETARQFEDKELMKKIRFLQLSNDTGCKAILGGVHFWSKYDNDKHHERNKALLNAINGYLEHNLAGNETELCTLLGDFNMNPYEPMLNTNPAIEPLTPCLLTSPNKDKTKQNWFYNPCWNLLGDRFSKINHTFSLEKSKGSDRLFNVFDQVLLRKGLFDGFQLDTLKIVDTANVSDHFPVIFEMKF